MAPSSVSRHNRAPPEHKNSQHEDDGSSRSTGQCTESESGHFIYKFCGFDKVEQKVRARSRLMRDASDVHIRMRERRAERIQKKPNRFGCRMLRCGTKCAGGRMFFKPSGLLDDCLSPLGLIG